MLNSITKERRHEQVRKRKNFLPTLAVTILLWGLVGAVVYFIDPANSLAIFLFFILVFFALLFTFATLFANTRRGLLISIGLTIFVILRYFGVGNFLNLILILALGLCIELYFIRTK